MKLGTDVRISPLAVFVHPDLVEIGDHVAIDPFTVFTTALVLGNYIHISPHCSIIGGRQGRLLMKDFTGLSPGCRILCSSDDFKGAGLTCPIVPMKYRSVTWSTITLERYAQLGANVVVMPGVTVGEGAVAGAGTIVTKDLEPWSIYVGAPARKVGERRRDRILRYAEEILRGESSSVERGTVHDNTHGQRL